MRTPLTDVNYLTPQGSHDADVSSYQGTCQFNRVRFTEGSTGLWQGSIWGANHGSLTAYGEGLISGSAHHPFNLGQLLSRGTR